SYLYAGLAAGTMVALPAFLRIKYDLALTVSALFFLLYAASVTVTLVWLVRRRPPRVFYATAATPLLLILLAAPTPFPFIEDYQSIKEVSARAGQLTGANRSVITYQFEDYNLRYYSGSRSIRVTNSPGELADLARRQGGSLYCIALTKGLNELEGNPQFE